MSKKAAYMPLLYVSENKKGGGQKFIFARRLAIFALRLYNYSAACGNAVQAEYRFSAEIAK